ncbi:hypothetical protein CcaverHIS002_0104130 [Cutaneotrichosporon cavernicola]|uniref:Uncharacterized protein n=1 Tax=Cutaneotrichosporon cavernicola TaxID=279322 RepID=A0AA48IDD7_9TREE|nr:uncharacterized protein CcaverHIS019_0104060 [Cutaneotrichosporon cavernicola]BEI79884.1 hypothetical protein CcaverHIS002_0104130 [Cutaneotrichosporon cavernicola]BEI87688.1 hypothetical protein CcaverHIS019_0104060 [Cutaneotrichosporon cavernicola]BEI95460.1 hypothetical protein CcaverHIS631_0104090 [Cutaneotrichosporon cavernicola]BEJ03234.1 hypothetical protein CcaverHIS641_0104090 [Cutaneotrichosporon cavernicola]
MALAHLSTLADTVPVDGVTMTAPRMRPRLSFWTPIVIKRWQARLGSQALTDRELPGAPYLPVQPSPAESSLVAPTSVAISEGVWLRSPLQPNIPLPITPSVPAQDTPKGLPAIPTKALPSASPTSTDPSPISSPTCTAEAFTTITINTGSGGLDRKLSVCSTSSSRYAGIPRPLPSAPSGLVVQEPTAATVLPSWLTSRMPMPRLPDVPPRLPELDFSASRRPMTPLYQDVRLCTKSDVLPGSLLSP